MDVDIDVDPRFKPASIFKTWPRAAVLKDGKLTAHPCGVYPQRIAVDPLTGLAAIPYDQAEDIGYLKVDFLHLNVYQHFKNRAEIEELLKKDPDWSLVRVPSVQAKLFQLAKQGDLLNDLKPTSIEELADVMALIRPGKRNLLGLYKKEIASFFANDSAVTEATWGADNTSSRLHYLRTQNPSNPEIMAGYPSRIATNRSNPYFAPEGYNTLKTLGHLKVFASYLCSATPVPNEPAPLEPWSR